MPDLTGTLLRWESPVTEVQMDAVLDALAALHREPWQGSLRDHSRGRTCVAACSS
jgi:hypothetical protein